MPIKCCIEECAAVANWRIDGQHYCATHKPDSIGVIPFDEEHSAGGFDSIEVMCFEAGCMVPAWVRVNHPDGEAYYCREHAPKGKSQKLVWGRCGHHDCAEVARMRVSNATIGTYYYCSGHPPKNLPLGSVYEVLDEAHSIWVKVETMKEEASERPCCAHPACIKPGEVPLCREHLVSFIGRLDRLARSWPEDSFQTRELRLVLEAFEADGQARLALAKERHVFERRKHKTEESPF